MTRIALVTARTDVNDRVETPFTDCPVVIRYRQTDTTRANAYREALAAVSDAGSVVQREFDADRPGRDPLGCVFVSVRDGDEVSVVVYERAKSDDPEVNRLSRVTVRAIARPE